nr:hypothetical protein [uncultured Prevotella sp.]
MEQFEQTYFDLHKIRSIVLNLRIKLSKEPFKSIVEPELLAVLQNIDANLLRALRLERSIFFSPVILDKLDSIYTKFRELSVDVKSEGELNIDKKKKFYEISKELFRTIRILKNELSHELISRPTVFNSEEYYEERIKQLESQKKLLEKELKEKQEENKINQEEKEDALRNAEEQIRNYKSELEEKKKQENAISEWRAKIKTTFVDLSGYLSPIKDEHQRLKYLYRTYAALTGIVVIFIVVLEIIICCKFSSTESFPNWKDHLTLLLPIPASGALLWAFISQLNRAQRQLVLLAKHIHEIEYTEGLLLSLNSLSIDMEDSMKRVNSAIDRLLDNHLSMGTELCRCDEDSIVKEEKKDMVPVDLILKLIKEAKGVALS